MICPHCGRYLEDGVAFCIYCGQRLGKYASGDAAEGSQNVNLSDAPAVDAAAGGDAPVAGETRGAHAAAASATAATAAAATAAAAPVAPASAQETPARATSGRASSRETGRLHADDEIARRMNELDKEPSSGRGRKILGGVILAGLVAGAVGFGATYMAPSILSDNGSSSSSAVASSSSSSASTSSSSSKGSSSSSSAKSSKSGTSSSSAQTKRGSTLENANARANGESTDDAVETETVEVRPTTGEETTTGVVNTYTPAPASGFTGAAASATSVSPTEGGVTHGPDLVLDGLPETAWNTNENGVGQSITITVDSLAEVNGLKIMNGYNKVSASGTDLYYANARAKKILIEYATGSFEYTLKDKKGKYQDIPFKDPQETTWVKITIQSVYPGNLYDDCCISEIEVY